MFADSDDYLHVDAIRVLYEALVQHPTCGLSMCNYKRTFTLDEDIRKVDENRIEILSVKQLLSIRDGSLKDVVWNKLYRHSLISDIMAREYRIAQVSWLIVYYTSGCRGQDQPRKRRIIG